MQKFEYKVLDVPSKGFWGFKIDNEILTATLNELGTKGWEVTAMNAMNTSKGTSHGIIILKREILH